MTFFPIVDIDKNCKTAFGELLTAQTTTLVHLHFDYNINTEITLTSTQNTGTVTQNTNTALLQTGTTTSSYAHIRSKRYASYSPGIGIDCRFTARFASTVGSSGYTIIGIGDSDTLSTVKPRDGYFIGYDFQTTASSNFYVFRYQDGNQTSINQTAFSLDKLDGTGPTGINMLTSLTRINVFRICFQWLSAGCIRFEIENPNTGLFEIFHEIQYANTSSTVSANNPSFRFFATTSNFLTAVNQTLTIPCATIMMQGNNWLTSGLTFSRSNSKNISTETNILTIRNKTTYASKVNRTVVKIKSISFASDGTKGFIFRCYLNTTLGGVPTYTDNSTNTSCIDYDTAGTTITGGRQLLSFAISKADNNSIDVDNKYIYIYPGDIFTLSAQTATAGDAFASVVWSEDL